MRASLVFTAVLPALLVGVVAARLDDRRSQRTLERFLSEIREAGTTDNRRRNTATIGLKNYIATLAASDVRVIEDILDAEPLADSRVTLIRGLGSIDGPESADAISRRLTELLMRPPDPGVGAELHGGFQGLSVMSHARAFEVLYDLLPTLPRRARPTALIAMTGKPEVFDHLDRIEAALRSSDPSTRAAAALALMDRAGVAPLEVRARIVTLLETRIPKESEPSPRQAMILALGSHRQPSSIDLLETVLETDPQTRSRERAVAALIAIGGRRAGEVLERHVERETNARIRVKAQAGAIDILEGGG